MQLQNNLQKLKINRMRVILGIGGLWACLSLKLKREDHGKMVKPSIGLNSLSFKHWLAVCFKDRHQSVSVNMP
jgi:hypothetical protein